jgi:hypothetical protein
MFWDETETKAAARENANAVQRDLCEIELFARRTNITEEKRERKSYCGTFCA